VAGEIKVYSLGDKGVNVSDDPLHTDVGDVTVAQNVTFYGAGRRGGLSKRLGMRAINTVAMAGAVLGIASFTFADPTATTTLVDGDGLILTDDAFMVLTE